jgi:Spy/CpxP family protein refolding chaperone
MAATLAAAVIAAVATVRLGAGGRTETPRLHDTAWLEKSLGLTAKQAAQVARFAENMGHEVAETCDRHCRAKAALQDVVRADAFDETAARARLAEMAEAQAAGDLAAVRFLHRVRTQLDAAQLAKFDRLVESCLCAECTDECCGAKK